MASKHRRMAHTRISQPDVIEKYQERTIDEEVMKKMPTNTKTFVEINIFGLLAHRLKVFLTSGK